MTTTRPTSAIFVYVDRDHGEVEVFSTFEKAAIYLAKQWGAPDFDISFDKDGVECIWHDLNSDYASIHRKTPQ